MQAAITEWNRIVGLNKKHLFFIEEARTPRSGCQDVQGLSRVFISGL